MSLAVVGQGMPPFLSVCCGSLTGSCLRKTTTMVYKILGIERRWRDCCDVMKENLPKPRQMFVTQSRMLATKVEEFYGKLAVSQGLDARAGLRNLELMINLDDEMGWRPDLPHRFGELEEKHFPLFVTFDDVSNLFLIPSTGSNQKLNLPLELCEMLEEEYRALRNAVHDVPSSSPAQKSMVTWQRFSGSYWPHFPQSLTKSLGRVFHCLKGHSPL